MKAIRQGPDSFKAASSASAGRKRKFYQRAAVHAPVLEAFSHATATYAPVALFDSVAEPAEQDARHCCHCCEEYTVHRKALQRDWRSLALYASMDTRLVRRVGLGLLSGTGSHMCLANQPGPIHHLPSGRVCMSSWMLDILLITMKGARLGRSCCCRWCTRCRRRSQDTGTAVTGAVGCQPWQHDSAVQPAAGANTDNMLVGCRSRPCIRRARRLHRALLLRSS